jgi:hypothetical protein
VIGSAGSFGFPDSLIRVCEEGIDDVREPRSAIAAVLVRDFFVTSGCRTSARAEYTPIGRICEGQSTRATTPTGGRRAAWLAGRGTILPALFAHAKLHVSASANASSARAQRSREGFAVDEDAKFPSSATPSTRIARIVTLHRPQRADVVQCVLTRALGVARGDLWFSGKHRILPVGVISA